MNRGHTVAELAHRWRDTEEDALRLLRQFEREGLAVEENGRWALTELAERRYGQALRDIGP